MIKMINPSIETKEIVLDFKNEMLEYNDFALNGYGMLDQAKTYTEWLELIELFTDPQKVINTKFVIGSQWMLVDTSTNRVLGMANLRHELNDHLLQFGGHIGYSIRPTERRKGYGKLQLKLALDVLKEHGVERVLVTCDDSNKGSYKTIEACGGVLDNKIEKDDMLVRRYWIDNTK